MKQVQKPKKPIIFYYVIALIVILRVSYTHLRCLKPVPRHLCFPRCFQKDGYGGRHGRSGYFCPHDFFICDKSDLQIYPGTGRT